MRALIRLLMLCIVIFFHYAYANKLKVITSFSILEDWVQEMGGDCVEVQNLVGVNQDPHHYQITPLDKIKLHNADIIFMQGLHFESNSILTAFNTHLDKIVNVSDALTADDLIQLTTHHLSNKEENKLFDPHTWHSIQLSKKNIKLISDEFIKRDPSHRVYYTKRYQAYLKKLDKLAQYAEQKFTEINSKNNTLITIHAGFQYLANDYHLNYVSLESGHHHTEVSAKHISEVIDTIRNNGVKYIFAEKYQDLRMAQAISKQTNIIIIENLYPDFLTDQHGEAPNYIAFMRHNINKITSYLVDK